MKIKAVEEASQLYNIVYDLPDELVDEFNRVKMKGGMKSIRDFLGEHAEVVSSEQQGEVYDFKLLKFEKGEDIVMANTYRTELVFNEDFEVPRWQTVNKRLTRIIKEYHNINIKRYENGDHSFVVYADAPMKSLQVYDILDALGYHELNSIKVYCEDDVNEYRRNYKVVATEKGWRVR